MQKHNLMKYLVLYERKIKQLKNSCNSNSNSDFDKISVKKLENTKKQLDEIGRLIE